MNKKGGRVFPNDFRAAVVSSFTFTGI